MSCPRFETISWPANTRSLLLRRPCPESSGLRRRGGSRLAQSSDPGLMAAASADAKDLPRPGPVSFRKAKSNSMGAILSSAVKGQVLCVFDPWPEASHSSSWKMLWVGKKARAMSFHQDGAVSRRKKHGNTDPAQEIPDPSCDFVRTFSPFAICPACSPCALAHELPRTW